MQCTLLTLLICSTNGWQLRTRYCENGGSLGLAAAYWYDAGMRWRHPEAAPAARHHHHPVITELPGTWRFACRLDGQVFDFVARSSGKRTPSTLPTTRIGIGRRGL